VKKLDEPRTVELTCNSCSHSYDTAELGCIRFLRCNIDGRACFSRCEHFQYEPGTDEGEQSGG